MSTASLDQVSAADLHGFGYVQELSRRVGTYASFAAGFSFVSILTTVFQLFFIGYGFGGTLFFWTWPVVLVGQLAVALCFAELAARYPISGAIFQWARRLGGSVWGWFAGWTMIIAQIITLATAAIALQVVLPMVSTKFQIIGDGTGTSGAENAVLLGCILLAITTALNAFSIRITAIVNSVGVTCELIGVTLLVILLFSHAHRGPSVVFHNSMLTSSTGYLTPLLMSALMAAYVMVGFDSAGELAEETHSPRAVTPRTIVRALIVSGVGGAFLLIAALMAAPSLTDGNLSSPTGGLPYVLTSVLGTTVGKLLLIDVAFAITVCTLAVQTAGARMIFSMARDEVLPFSGALRKVSPRFHTPLLATVVPGVGAAICLLVNVKNAALFLGLASVCIMLLYIAYLMVTAPMLISRVRGGKLAGGFDENGKPLFTLGKFGLVVNIVAVAYGLLMAINLGLPRQAVYDPGNTGWYVHYLPILTILATFGLGAVAYAFKRGAYHSTVSVEAHAMLGGLEEA